ncbi:CYTH domain-containing protein [Snodgrassella communis]|uniref:CYTH domain-containing protein n=1 Tax=Snodgrassella communis TaxID=2946699 RepID=UPI000C1DC749|nr:CYTH domain-containing protein [Snodgrassella communis]PIT07930.1 adenylate cyclase [Snodgrassella communis]
MTEEIERKFLVEGNGWRGLAPAVYFCQGYLSTIKERTVRVRVCDTQAWLTIKSTNQGITRTEFEYSIPVEDAQHMLRYMIEQPVIEKYRYHIRLNNLVWEVDEFLGANQGLIVAEVELSHANQQIVLPDWIGQEVSDDPRYYNSNLVSLPFTLW